MSLPKFPVIDPPLCIEDSLSMILASIAMEELALSHIINAEGEKLQYILGTLDGCHDKEPTTEEVMAVNKSVKCLLDSVMQNQMILKAKMECALSALDGCKCCIPGPPGPPGPPGRRCAAIGRHAHPWQCWKADRPLTWQHTDCDNDECIRLECGKDYALSFSLDICSVEHDCKCLAVGVQTDDGIKKQEHFVSHTPAPRQEIIFTASCGGIFIPARRHDSELALVLLSPSAAKVKQGSICVMEI